MERKFSISDIYDKNINFLIGAGASYGLFPTLALNIEKDTGNRQTIETIAVLLKSNNPLYTLLFMHYYKKCIEPVITFDLESAKADHDQKKVIDNYEKFIGTLLTVLQRKKNSKSCNIFTTNYDECFTHVADDLLQHGGIDFILNDGAKGFSRKYLQAKNFKSFVYQTGAFDLHRSDIPQINLIHLHGSACWHKDKESIRVDYSNSIQDRLISIDGSLTATLDEFSGILADASKNVTDLSAIELSPVTDEHQNAYWDSYKKLPIVNPTKWKFHETVFEEHYYQMLRFMSYELEKQNSIFITFGFSFADEHILNLVKRSLSNPYLELFICCFDEAEHEIMKEHFKGYKNVQYITADEPLNFTIFNSQVFSINPEVKDAAPEQEGANNDD